MFGTITALALTLLPNAHAVEVAWDGHYRARGRYFNSLSLAAPEENEFSEESSLWIDHRLRLAPTFKFSNSVSVFTEVDVLPFVTWGGNPSTLSDPVTGEEGPAVYANTVNAPTTAEGADSTQNVQARRVFAEVTNEYATIRFGRMPVEWGSGMVYNAGNDPLSEYGDTADRIQVTAPVGALYLIGAAETSAENFVNQNDDLVTLTGGVAYLGERYGVGSYNTYRKQTFEDDSEFKIFTADIWAKAELGMTEIEFEFAFQTGSGNLSQDVNDVRISGIGTQLTALVGNDKMRVGASSGLATGDQDPVDNQFRAFSFDPDFNVALMMFEEPMPALNHENANLSSNGGREWGAVRLGEGISNALYVRPALQYTVKEGLDLEIAWIGAKAAKLPESESDNDGYGSEFDFTIDYRPFDHFRLTSTTGYFMPGKYISSFEHEELGGGFSSNAIGSRLVGTVNF